MTLLHLHLLLNHVPVVGAAFLVLLFGLAALRKDSSLARLGLIVCVGLAAITGAVYLTGGAAEELAEKISGVSERAISIHEEAAETSMIAFAVFGVLALGSLILYRHKPIPRAATVAALGLTLIVGGIMAWTANLGGNIRHTEIQTAAAAGTAITEHDD